MIPRPRFPRNPALPGALVLAGLLLSACGHTELVENLAPPGHEAFAREFIFNLTRGGEVEMAYGKLDSALRNATGRNGLEQIEQLFGRGSVRKIEPIGIYLEASIGNRGTQRNTHLTYQLQITTGWFSGVVVITGSGEECRVLGVHFAPIAGDLEVANRFARRDVGPGRIVFLVLCGAVPVFCLITLVVCFRAKIRHRIPWMIFIAIPVGSASLDWTTGDVSLSLVSFTFLGSMVAKASLYSPWIFTVSLPLGAILFWGNRRDIALPRPPSLPK